MNPWSLTRLSVVVLILFGSLMLGYLRKTIRLCGKMLVVEIKVVQLLRIKGMNGVTKLMHNFKKEVWENSMLILVLEFLGNWSILNRRGDSSPPTDRPSFLIWFLLKDFSGKALLCTIQVI